MLIHDPISIRVLLLNDPPTWEDGTPTRYDLNYSARTKAGVALECLPTKEGLLVGLLLVKPTDAETLATIDDPVTLREYFNSEFPMFTEFVSDEDLAATAARRVSTLSSFAYAGGGCLHRVGGRGLHSSTFRLNVSAFCGIGGAFSGC
jgi:hypothetical protein